MKYSHSESSSVQQDFWTLIVTYTWVFHWKTSKKDKSEITTNLAVKTTAKCSFRGNRYSCWKKKTLFTQSCIFGQLQSAEFHALFFVQFDTVITFHSNCMKIMSNPPILKYSNFYNVWASCAFLTGALKVQVS